MNIKKVIISENNRYEIFKEFQNRNYKWDFILKDCYEITKNDIKDCDLFIGFQPPVNTNLQQVKWIHSSGAGVDKFFIKTNIIGENTILTRVRGSFGYKISQYVTSFILRENLLHQTYQENKVKKKWNKISPLYLKNQKILIFGCGNIGIKIAETLTFLGATCNGIVKNKRDIKPFKQILTFDDIKKIDNLHEYDFIVIILPLTKNTRYIISNEILQKFKNSTLINVGRGALIKEDDLLKAISTNNIKKAYLDVFEEEPLPQDSSLWHNNNIFITPHIAAITEPCEVVDSFEECFYLYNTNKQNELFVNLKNHY